MFTLHTTPSSVWHIVTNGLRLYRASILKVWYWQIIFVVPALLLGRIDAWLNPHADLPLFTLGYGSFTVASTLITALTLLMGHCFTYNRMWAVGTSGDTRIQTSLRLSFRKLPIVFITGIVLLAAIATVGAPFYFLSSQAASGFAVFVGTVILYALVVCILMLAILYPFFILFEQNGVFDSLKNSARHVWGNFLRTLNVCILISLGGMVVILTLLLVPVSLVSTFGSSPAILTIGIFGVILGYIAIFTFGAPIINAVLLTLYHDLKLRKAQATA